MQASKHRLENIKMKSASNNAITALLIATIVISIGGAFISLNTINSKLIAAGISPITGFATSVPNGTATVTINTVSSIKFARSTSAFGSGSVNTVGGYNNCSLVTRSGNNPGCTDFLNQSGFIIENDGNTNLSVELRSNISAADFIGAGGAFAWNVSLNESNSCVNISGSKRTSVYPNTSLGCGTAGGASSDCGAIFEAVSTTNKNICPSLRYEDSNDGLNIDINITIPFDAPAGAKVAGIIITGTREPTS